LSGSDEQRDSDSASSAGAPGPLSRLLQELAEAPGDGLLDAWKNELRPGARVGRFEIRREVGHGGFGAVFEAFDTRLNRVVAVKTLRFSRPRRDLATDWVKKEAEAVARLDHPCIVTLFDMGTCPSGAYLVMELLHGRTLAQRIAEWPIPVAEALRIAEEMAKGLAHAHQRGVLHRDLKPANVFLCDDGRVKLLDFGLANLLGSPGQKGAGTPAYMAPEQARGEEVDERSDVYAAAMVLGEMISGRRPGEPAVLPGSAAPKLAGMPRPVAKVIGTALAPDPTVRPRDGLAWLDVLRSARVAIERPRRMRKVAVLASIFLGLGVGAVGLATWRIWERQFPAGRITVAVADFSNETGEKELDSLSGLLITTLEQSAQFRVVTRGRMFDVLRQAGKGEVQRIDESMAREVGSRTHARALLLPNIRRLDDSYVVDMRALDPVTDEYLFTAKDRAGGKAEIFDLVDRLGEVARRRLKGGGIDSFPPPRVASITTDNVKAWEHLYRARQAFDQGRLKESRGLAEAALREDPEFALAHYQLALVVWWDDHLTPSGNKAASGQIEAAERHADRLPEKERLSLLAMRAAVDGRWEKARQLRDQAAEAYPLDKEMLLYAANVRALRDDFDGSIPILDRALQLDPQYGPAILALLQALMWSGRGSERIAWMRGLASSTTDSILAPAVLLALLSEGLEKDAVAALRRAQAQEGLPWPPPVYAEYLAVTGRAAEAESGIRSRLAAIPSGATEDQAQRIKGLTKTLTFHLAMALVAQGRLREADSVIRGMAGSPRELQFLRLGLATSARSREDAQRAGKEFVRQEVSDVHSVVAPQYLALAGDVADAALLTRRLRGDPFWDQLSPSELLFSEGIQAWGEGALDVAADLFRRGADSQVIMVRYMGLAFLGELSRTRGDCAAAVQALDRALAIRWTQHLHKKAWFDPGLLHSLAICHEQMGNLASARERNEELLRLWARADPGLPLLVDAKAMQARLAAASR
jgi:tetratricopeptide (TPR) repeat protein